MLVGRALSPASSRSSASLKFSVDFPFFSAIFISWIIVEIQTKKRMSKANFAENVVNFVRRSGMLTCDVFIANNQAVTNTVK